MEKIWDGIKKEITTEEKYRSSIGIIFLHHSCCILSSLLQIFLDKNWDITHQGVFFSEHYS